MHKTIRKRCLITGKDDLENLITLKRFPVFIGATEQPLEKDEFHDMSWAISKGSGIIQLNELLPLEVIYSGFHSEAVGSVWENHRIKFSEFTIKHKNIGDVLEIGGSDGKTASAFYENCNDSCEWMIVEPNLSPKTEKLHSNIKFVDGFVEDKIKDFGKVQNFVHSHVLEHLYDPVTTINAVAEHQGNGDRMIFSIPNLQAYLESLFVNALNFEHTYYLTDAVVEYFMANSGYKILEKSFYRNHSIFYAAEKCSTITQKSSFGRECYVENKDAYLSLIAHYEKEVQEYNKIIDAHPGDVFLFGGHIFSQFLIYMGLKSDRVISILDNSIEKQGKRLYGSTLQIESPQRVIDSALPMVILKVGQYFDEVQAQLIKLNPNSVIVE